MTSSVHFKFKSQKEPSRVSFDGTGISVFELKREIINQNRLGDGSDFELAIYNEDTNEEYDDDTTIIPRSTSIIARRLPAARPGKGTAARYVTGKMPVTARPAPRVEASASQRPTNGHSAAANNTPDLSSAQSEDEKIKALFNLQESQWREQQEDMASATPVPFGRGKGAAVNVPDYPPPPGYLCYRCREKGHWIQACPTNNDPKFDGRYRVKRSTGIPRSFQKQVERPDTHALDGTNEDPKLTGVMVNADGDFVIAEPDKASWELYQEKAKASAAAAAEIAAAEANKELQSRGLLCPIDKRVLLAPTKTPCCKGTYCNDCITNALIESDFVCPGCNADGVLLDNLTVDEDAITRLKEYESETAAEDKEKSVEEPSQEPSASRESGPQKDSPKSSDSVNQPQVQNSKKRAAEDNGENGNADEREASAVKKQKPDDQTQYSKIPSSTGLDSNGFFPPLPFNQPMPMGFPGAPMQQNFSMPPPFVGHNPGAFAPYPGNTWGQQMGTNYPPAGPQGFYPNNTLPPRGGAAPANFFPQQVASSNFNQMPNQMQQQFPFQQPSGMAPFANQQRTNFSGQFPKEEENAYFRQPVNPHRHQARQRRLRPSDYREL